MIEKPTGHAQKQRSLCWNAVIGVIVGALFSLTPFTLLVYAVPGAFAIGIYYWLTRRRTSQFQGLLPTVAFALATMIGAMLLPTKFEDERVGPLTGKDISVSGLVAAGLAYEPREASWNRETIHLASITPTRREILQAINSQTALSADYYGCGTMATCWRGGAGGKIRLRSKQPMQTVRMSEQTEN